MSATTTTTAQSPKPSFAAGAPGAAAKWSIDGSHTSVTFGVRHMMVSTVRGEFQKVSGDVVYDPTHPEKTEINVSIDVASVNTREPQRDAHLKSADFFDAEKFPTIEFRSRQTSVKKAGLLEIVGDLTIHGTTRAVTLEVEGPTPEHGDPWGFVRMGASARTTVKRSEFGMTWNTLLEAGGVLVGDEIKIQLEVELQRPKA
jgi:polyisoprenoid-binding protein YceI